MSSENDTAARPGASRPGDWAKRHDLSRSQVYKMIASGEVIARKVRESNPHLRRRQPRLAALASQNLG
jgi:hypothetical protein